MTTTLRKPDVTLLNESGRPWCTGDNPTIVADLKDEAGAAIPGTALDEATVTIINESDLAIINNRDEFDIKALVDENGHLVFTLDKDDMFIQNEENVQEFHRVRITYQYTPADDLQRKRTYEIRLPIEDVDP